MKKVNIIIGLLIFWGTILAQEINKKNGYRIFYYKNGNISSEGLMRNGKPDGLWKSYYETGGIKTIGKRKNYQLDSTWVFYNVYGDVVAKINYKINRKNGFSYAYYTSEEKPGYIGNIKAKELYVNNLKQGIADYYYPNGMLQKKTSYKNDIKHGDEIIYNKKGIIIEIKKYNKGHVIAREKINQYNDNGKKEGVWKEFYADGNLKKELSYKNGILEGNVKEFDKKGQIVLNLEYKKGKIQDRVEEEDIVDVVEKFDKEGNIIYRGVYKDSIPIGIHRKFNLEGAVTEAYLYNLNGKIIEKGIIDEAGVRNGYFQEYYMNGKIKAEGKYVNNKKNGLWKFYFENGNLEQEGRYRNGKEDELWKWYFENGNTKLEEAYFNGKEEGYSVEYNENEEIIAKGEYYDGEKEGEWFYKVGDEKQEGVFVGGMKDGKWKYYYDTGQLKFEGNYIQGVPDGIHRYYYPNGNIKEEQNFSNGIKQKHWKKYDELGNLFLTISYEDNKEIRINGVKVKLPYDDIIIIE